MSNSTNLIAALDYGRFDAIADYAEVGSSYLTSVREAAFGGERLNVEVRCRPIAAVTRKAFGVAKIPGTTSDKAMRVA